MGLVKVTCLPIKAGSGLGFSFGFRTWTIWCVKVVPSETNLVLTIRKCT